MKMATAAVAVETTAQTFKCYPGAEGIPPANRKKESTRLEEKRKIFQAVTAFPDANEGEQSLVTSFVNMAPMTVLG